MTPQVIMFLMFPWFAGHLCCLFMDGEYISTTEQSLINFAGSFTVPEKQGLWNAMTSGFEFFTETFARVFLWDYSFFEGDYAIFRWLLLFVLTVPFIIGFVFAMKSAVEGIFRRT